MVWTPPLLSKAGRLIGRLIPRDLQSPQFLKLRKNYEREKAKRDFEAMENPGGRETYIVFKKEK